MTSDLGFVQAEGLAEDHTGEEVVVKSLYSLANGTPIDGIANQMVYSVSEYSSADYQNRICLGSETSILAIEYTDYGVLARDKELFYSNMNPRRNFSDFL